jgi:hypothetical protein
MDTAETAQVCEEHVSEPFISRSSFLMNATAAFSSTANTDQTLEELNPKTTETLIFGRLELWETMEGERSVWGSEDCDMCCLVEFLLGKAGWVFMLGLVVLNRLKTFEEFFSLLVGHASEEDLKLRKEQLEFYGEFHRKERAPAVDLH